MAYPSIIDDGSFRTAQQNGPWRYSFPFSDKGDFKSFIATRKMRIDADYFSPPTPMTKRQFKMGVAYLVDMDDSDNVDGARLLDYEEIWAMVPVTRTEIGQSAILRNEIVSDKAVAFTASMTTEEVYEYGLEPFPQITAYRGLSITGTDFVVGGVFRTNGTSKIIAKNSVGGIYMGKIYERISYFYTPPTIKSQFA